MNIEEELNMLADEKDAVKSSIALNKILYALLLESKKREMRVWSVSLSLVLVIIVMIISYFVYESQFEKEETTTETSYSYAEASGDNAAINNVQGDQFNDNASQNNYPKGDK